MTSMVSVRDLIIELADTEDTIRHGTNGTGADGELVGSAHLAEILARQRDILAELRGRLGGRLMLPLRADRS